MNNQKGLIPLLIVLIIAAAIGGYFIYQNQTKTTPVQQATQLSPTPMDASPPPTGAGETTNRGIPKSLSISASYKIISPDDISPDQKYIIGQVQMGDYITIEVARNNAGTANYITTDLVKENEKEIGYNVKFGCMCATSFKGWISESKFIIKIVNGNGEEYEYIVDAESGKVDESSLKRTK